MTEQQMYQKIIIQLENIRNVIVECHNELINIDINLQKNLKINDIPVSNKIIRQIQDDLIINKNSIEQYIIPLLQQQLGG